MPPRPRPIPSLLLALALAAAAALGPAPARAGNENATVGFYLGDPVSRPCGVNLPACEDPDLSLAGELNLGYYVYLCVFKGDAQEGIAGVQLSLHYDGGRNSGVDVSSWNLCATLEFPGTGWPAPRVSNVITWDPVNACQEDEPDGFGTGVTALAGWFYVTAYSDDLMEVRPRTGGDGTLSVANCLAASTQLLPEQGGSVAFSSDGATKGKLPCSSREIEEATWGRIKDEYGRDR